MAWLADIHIQTFVIGTGLTYWLCIYKKLEATRALKPPPQNVLPSGEHSGVFVYAIPLGGEQFWMIQNAQKRLSFL